MASMLAFYSDYLSLNPTEILIVSILLERGPDLSILKFIRTKRSERAKRAHSVLREVEKMGYKKIFAHTRIG